MVVVYVAEMNQNQNSSQNFTKKVNKDVNLWTEEEKVVEILRETLLPFIIHGWLEHNEYVEPCFFL